MFNKFFYSLVRKSLSDWLTNRALHVPAEKVHADAVKFGVSDEVVIALEAQVAAEVVAALDVRFGYKN